MTTDHTIKENTPAELNWEPKVAAGHIGMAVRNGMATLSGRA